MPPLTKIYAFCQNYDPIYDCLSAIQNKEETGAFDADPELLQLIRTLDRVLIKKLFLSILKVLLKIDRAKNSETYIGGDFDERQFQELVFHVGYRLLGEEEPDSSETTFGDFNKKDFVTADYLVGAMDVTGVGYSATFKSVLNLLAVLCSRLVEISENDRSLIDESLIAVLDAFEVLQEKVMFKGFDLCLSPDELYLNNTANVFLQVAGSDGANGIPEGWHIRWSFRGEMGANHIPRGNFNLSNSQTVGFNRPKDFVQIFRTPYVTPVNVTLDFQNTSPIIDSSRNRWTYLVSQVMGNKTIDNRIRLTFLDKKQYNQLAVGKDLAIDPFGFFKKYNGLFEIEVVNKRVFSAGFTFHKNEEAPQAALKIEGLSEVAKGEESDPIYVRQTIVLTDNSSSNATIIGDNLKSFKLKSDNGYLQSLSFESYHDFLSTRNEADWTEVGQGFSLSEIDSVVFDRLENPAYPIDNIWPQYNNGTKVRAANYRDKWMLNQPNEVGLKTMVQTYFNLSETDPRAMAELQEVDALGITESMPISYVDLINLHATDFHMARMLGFGHIDVIEGTSQDQRFVYQLRYDNRTTMGVWHIIPYRYTSLPTSKLDKLLPEKPIMREIKHDFSSEDDKLSVFSNDDGYNFYQSTRVINIGRTLFNDEKMGYDFFNDLYELEGENIFKSSRPIFYGIEYREAQQTTYVKPELTQEKQSGEVYYAYDDDYPISGIPEVVPVPDNESSLYVHMETEPGVHFYAIYGINWFSRTSELSDEVATDETKFLPVSTLAPPTDFAVQYIQKEEQLLFTTAREQQWLALRNLKFPGKDTALTRVNFKWVDLVDISFTRTMSPADLAKEIRADKAKLFFRPNLPLEIIGVIKNSRVGENPEKHRRLAITSYKLFDGTIVTPTINPADYERFKDSLLTTPEGQFRVIGIDEATPFPVITIELVAEDETIENPDEPIFGVHKRFVSPELNSRFSMVENLSNPDNWSALVKDVSLISFANSNQPVIETFVDTEGGISKLWVGGITGNAEVVQAYTNDDDPEPLPGVYLVTFDSSVLLPPHPQVNLPYSDDFPDNNDPSQPQTIHVEWYKGVVRMPIIGASEDRKQVDVQIIDSAGSSLKLHIYDPNYETNPIVLGNAVSVNFHPGYQAYLFSEATASTFNSANILPAEGVNDKKTLLAVQSSDTRTDGSVLVSQISMPTVLMARRIEEPLPMEKPMVATLKVRPDPTGKAAFTFDVRIPAAENGAFRNPFGFMFYRTSADDVLDALYNPVTVKQILEDLSALDTDLFYYDRLYELVNLIFDPSNPMQFKVFSSEPPYGFPAPDHIKVLQGQNGPPLTNDEKLSSYKLAIRSTLMPLSEQIPIYSLIKEGLQTENKLPMIKDVDGNILNPSDSSFDGFPMARKYQKEGSRYVRFTDYTLSGSSRNLYFYAGAEVTNQLSTGDLSPFAGPVQILHTLPADAPIVRSFSAIPVSRSGDSAVTFKLSSIPASEQISKIQLYRTTGSQTSIQMMKALPAVDVEIGNSDGYEIIDDFSDLMSIPAGETLTYRLVGIREIINEFEQWEEVPSQPSQPMVVKLIDTRNPEAPSEIMYVSANQTLHWMPTTLGGTYHLYKQNFRGNWERIYSVTPADNSEISYLLPVPLQFEDQDGNKIYHHFKVQVQSSSGLMNLTDQEITISE